MSGREAPVPMEVANDLMALALRYDRARGHEQLVKSARRGAETIRSLAKVHKTDDATAVLFFLRGAAEDGVLYNGRTAREAFDAAARMMGLDPAFAWERLG